MEKFLCRVSLKTVHPKSHSLFPRAMSQSPKGLDECREGQKSRQLAAEFLIAADNEENISACRGEDG